MTKNVSNFTKYLISHFYCNIYIFGDSCPWWNFAPCKIDFMSKSCVLLYCHRYCTAVQQRASAKRCGVVQRMELLNFRRGRHLYSAGRPSRWASADILVLFQLSSWRADRCSFVNCCLFAAVGTTVRWAWRWSATSCTRHRTTSPSARSTCCSPTSICRNTLLWTSRCTPCARCATLTAREYCCTAELTTSASRLGWPRAIHTSAVTWSSTYFYLSYKPTSLIESRTRALTIQ